MIEDDWDHQPTALEAAHYDDLLRRQNIRAERQRAEREERNRMVFGDCLNKLLKLGVAEKKARSMLGKWRGQAKDDALLVRIISKASEIAAPEPVSYITKALAGSLSRSNDVEKMTKRQWEAIGWEAPRMTPRGPEWKHGSRGRVWRDPHGRLQILAAEKGTVVPGLDVEPGIEVKGVA